MNVPRRYEAPMTRSFASTAALPLLRTTALVLAAFATACSGSWSTKDAGEEGAEGSVAAAKANEGAPSSPSNSNGGSAASSLASEVVGCGYGEPNEARENAKVLALGSELRELCMANGDTDFFEFVAPMDSAGGFVEIDYGNVGNGWLESEVYSARDNGSITRHAAEGEGASFSEFVATMPGEKYRVRAANYVSSVGSYSYDVAFKYTKLVDAFEPNDTRELAKPIAKNSAVSAMMTAGYVRGELPNAAYDDWYSIDLAAGAVSLKLENVPNDAWLEVEVKDSKGNVIEGGKGRGSNHGADVELWNVPVAGGSYAVRVGLYVAEPNAAGVGTIPDHFTRPYKLTLTQ